MIEYGAGEHETVEQSYGHANRNAVLHLAQHAAGGGAVNVEARILAPVGGRDHEGLAVDGETDVAEESFVEDAVGRLAIVDAAVGFADHAGARGGHLRFRD